MTYAQPPFSATTPPDQLLSLQVGFMRRLTLDIDEFKRLYFEEMLSHRDMAVKLGCCTTCVTHKVKELGLVRDRTAITNANRRAAGVMASKAKYKGIDHPRYPSKFRFMFLDDRCGWIRCPNPLASSSKWDVDHNHNCNRHDTSHCACRHCVRAFVHHRCNIVIEHWEWAQSEGLPVPDDVASYLSKGQS